MMLIIRQLRFCLLISIFFCVEPSLSQEKLLGKPIIDSSAVKHWVRLRYDYPTITSDGHFVAYMVQNQPYLHNTLVIQATATNWKREFLDASPVTFSKDSRRCIFIVKDTLYFFLLGTDQLTYISGVVSYQQPGDAKGEWIAWQVKGNSSELTLHNLLTGEEQQYLHVSSYAFNNTGRSLLLHTILKGDTSLTTTLQLAYPIGAKATQIWSSEEGSAKVSSYAMDTSGMQVTFMLQRNDSISKETTKKTVNQLWYYKVGMPVATLKAHNNSYGIMPGLYINGEPRFSKNGTYIFFLLESGDQVRLNPDLVNLDVWSYRDTILQCTQLYHLKPTSYLAEIPVQGKQVFQLLQDYESLVDEGGDYIVVRNNYAGDRSWVQQESNFLISLAHGSRKLLKTRGYNDGLTSYTSFRFSPEGKYLVYYDAGQECNYFCYNLMTGQLINLSSSIPKNTLAWASAFDRSAILPILSPPLAIGIAGWEKQDNSVFIYDNYDVWQFDLTARKPPINITKGYGRVHNIKFRIGYGGGNRLIQNNDSLLLMAFNMANKQTGFYRCIAGKSQVPKLLTMDRCFQIRLQLDVYSESAKDFDLGMQPVRAGNCNAWIIKRQTASEAPNYFLTSDFKNFKALTQLQPQQSYNWLTAELVNFTQLDGTVSQGVLYKPENFDPKRKYPILFNYYEQLSQRLYQYPTPEFTGTDINISWFVSHGYLVFTPDIYFIRGKIGYSAYNTVVGAAMFLGKLPYVDNKRMGINGHSFGGFLTNYIITHTHLFAAAIEGAGTSDLISSSLQLWGIEGREMGSRYAGYEQMFGNSLWENPDIYIENSPIVRADKVTTPLIIFHSKADVSVPWGQAVELFIALRRLDKKVWMLQYEGQGHANFGKAAEDYTTRIMQFFDHYLKGAPAPKWMTLGIPARLKGIESGLELDRSGRQP